MTPKERAEMHARAATKLASIPQVPPRKPRGYVSGQLALYLTNMKMTPEQRVARSKRANAIMRANKRKRQEES